MTDRPTYLILYEFDNGIVRIAPDCEMEVVQAVERWVKSGKTADTLLDLTMPSGARYCVLASRISAIVVSTYEQRRRATEQDKGDCDEKRATRAEAGFIGDED